MEVGQNESPHAGIEVGQNVSPHAGIEAWRLVRMYLLMLA